MKPTLENILNEIENSQSQINNLLKEAKQLQKFKFRNIICNREKQIHEKLFKIHKLQGKVHALMWVISE